MASQRFNDDVGRQSNSNQSCGVNCSKTRKILPLERYRFRSQRSRGSSSVLPSGGYSPETTPVVRLHFQVFACFHAQVDATAVTNQSVENPLEKVGSVFAKTRRRVQRLRIILHDPTSTR